MTVLSACRCEFQEERRKRSETGIAITIGHGSDNVVCIIPDTATTYIDVLKDVWNYQLDWSHSIDGDALHCLKVASNQAFKDALKDAKS